MKYKQNYFYSCIAIFVILALWQIVALSGKFPKVLLPTPLEVFSTLFSIIISGELPRHILVSLFRLLPGLTMAVLVGISLGVLVGRYKKLDLSLMPLIDFLRGIPIVCILIVAILVLGIGEKTKVFVVFYISLWPILINTIYGVRSVDELQIFSAQSIGASEDDLILKVILPASLKYTLAGLRLGVSSALVGVILSEVLAANNGLGYFIFDAERNFQTREMYAGIIAVGILSILFNLIFKKIENKLLVYEI
jgi:NitT/TauT family transport system permease protein